MENTQPESSEYQPKQSMRTFVQVLLSSQVMGSKTVAERITGVNKQNFHWHMRTKPEFRTWFEGQCDKALMSRRVTIDRHLLKSVMKGDVQAMRTYYEMIGKLKNKVEHSGEVKGGDITINNVTPERTIVFQDIKQQEGENVNDRMGVVSGGGS